MRSLHQQLWVVILVGKKKHKKKGPRCCLFGQSWYCIRQSFFVLKRGSLFELVSRFLRMVSQNHTDTKRLLFGGQSIVKRKHQYTACIPAVLKVWTVTRLCCIMDFIQGFTSEVRAYNFDTGQPTIASRLDLLVGARFVWNLAFYRNNTEATIYY